MNQFLVNTQKHKTKRRTTIVKEQCEWVVEKQTKSLVLGSGPAGRMQIREGNKRCGMSMFMADVKGNRPKMMKIKPGHPLW